MFRSTVFYPLLWKRWWKPRGVQFKVSGLRSLQVTFTFQSVWQLLFPGAVFFPPQQPVVQHRLQLLSSSCPDSDSGWIRGWGAGDSSVFAGEAYPLLQLQWCQGGRGWPKNQDFGGGAPEGIFYSWEKQLGKKSHGSFCLKLKFKLSQTLTIMT